MFDSLTNLESLIINFSGRKSNGKGNCEQIGKYLAELLGTKSVLVNFSSMNINSCNGCEYECLTRRSGLLSQAPGDSVLGNCKYSDDSVIHLYDMAIKAERLIYIIPIYSDFPCSNYAIFRERGQGYFNDEKYSIYSKKDVRFIVVGNTGDDNVLNMIRSDFPQASSNSLLTLSSNNYGLKSVDGNLLSVRDVKKRIFAFVKPEK